MVSAVNNKNNFWMNLKMNLHMRYLLERTVHFGQTV